MVLLISTYDLGRQPFGLASAASALAAAGREVICADLAKQRLDEESVRRSEAVAFFLPMHTATRLALPVIDRVRRINPAARLIAYGLYAPLNRELLEAHGVSAIIGGEFEAALVDSADGRTDGAVPVGGAPDASGRAPLPRVTFRVPDRSGLLPLAKYATLQEGSERRMAGSTEASRGCKHRCRHCPIVPVYDGRFRIVPVDIVMADIRAQVAAGATHISFGDPDFFNGIKHARAVLDAFRDQYPGVTFDVTIKIEHLLQYAEELPRLVSSGCAFVTSAVESVNDEILATLEKGHTRADFERVVAVFRENGLTLSPTFVAFTPWTTIEGYCELLQAIDRLELVDHVAPIQLAIRLLVTGNSRLLEVESLRARLLPFDPKSLTYPWPHPDERVDALQKQIESLVGTQLSASRRELFERIWTLAHDAAGLAVTRPRSLDTPARVIPYLNEPWYCCAEPTADQVRLL